MIRIGRKLIRSLQAIYTAPDDTLAARRQWLARTMPAPQTSSLANEFLAWAQWLDGLRDASQSGNEAAVWALAHGKLQFILRRALLLREKVMLGSPKPAQASEAASLSEELEQVIGELTGHIMPAVDEWPLPVRLYSKSSTANDEPAISILDRRKSRPQRQNRLDKDSRQAAQQACASLQLVLTVLQQHAAHAEPGLLHKASASLVRTVKLGRLLDADN